MFQQKQLQILFLLTCSILCVQTYKIKSYNLNKYTTFLHHFDCPQTTRNVSIPREFTFCVRHKKMYHQIKNNRWTGIFIGTPKTNGSRIGIEFGYWRYVPWLGLSSPSKTGMSWVGPGREFDFNMLTWRHTCITFNLEDGSVVMFENGRLAGENKFEEFVSFGKAVPDFVATLINVGCVERWQESHSGVVTDFQLFGRVLTHQELEKWTGCEDRLLGDLVSWDSEDWFFNKTGNGSRIEYLEFEHDVCDLRNMSHHFFPGKRSFQKSLELCKKISGKLNE